MAGHFMNSYILRSGHNIHIGRKFYGCLDTILPRHATVLARSTHMLLEFNFVPQCFITSNLFQVVEKIIFSCGKDNLTLVKENFDTLTYSLFHHQFLSRLFIFQIKSPHIFRQTPLES